MAELCAAVSQTLIRQQAMLPRKSLLAQMHAGSLPQLPMPPVRNLLAQSCWSDDAVLAMRSERDPRGPEGGLDGTHSAGRELGAALRGDGASQSQGENNGGDLHDGDGV